MFQQRWVPLAKIYYTLDALGAESKLSPDVFKAIHGTGIALWDDEQFFDWAASKGLDRKKVEEVFTSFAIDGKMKRAMQLAQQYQIQSVPTVIVDGKFVTSSDRVGTHAASAGGDRRADREGARRAEVVIDRGAGITRGADPH